jgi:acyl-CoA hydrolase
MNFSRSRVGVINPVSNRLLAAMLATFVALLFSVLGSTQWASADSHGDTVPDPTPTPVPGTPTDVAARPGNESAAVGGVPAFDDVTVDGFVIVADPSGISVEARPHATHVIVEGLENSVAYTFTVVAFNENGRSEPSEPSEAVTPSHDHELTDEELRRLREHLAKRAHAAKLRFEEAKKRARAKLEQTKGRVHDRLETRPIAPESS